MTPDDLATRLLEWDGKHTEILIQAHADLCEENGYLDSLVALCGNENSRLQDAASWLILHMGKEGTAFDPTASRNIVDTLKTDGSWAHALHICQAMKYLDLTKEDATALLPKLQALADHKRPFVRAWALDAVVVLAKRYGEKLVQAARAMLTTAEEDPAASVRARVRNIAL